MVSYRVKNLGNYAKKGHVAWNKGTKGIMKSNMTSFKKGCTSYNKGKKVSEKTKRKNALSSFKIIIIKKILYDLYNNQKLSFQKIASLYGVGRITISRLYKFYGFKSRSLSEAGLIRHKDTKKVTINREGYKQIYINGKKIREHRVIIEKYIGRKLIKGEVIHHINGDKKDNRIENLKIMMNDEHSKLHGGKI